MTRLSSQHERTIVEMPLQEEEVMRYLPVVLGAALEVVGISQVMVRISMHNTANPL